MMLPVRKTFGCQWTAGLAFLFLCICSCRVDLCWGKNHNHTTTNETSATTVSTTLSHPPLTRANRFPSVATRVKLYMSNWYTPPCEGDKDAFVHYQYDSEANPDDDEEKEGLYWPTLRVEAYKDHPVVNQTTRVLENIQSIIEPDMLFFMDQDTIINCGNYSYDDEWGDLYDPYQKRIAFRHNMRLYCEDVQKLLLPSWRHLRWMEQLDAKPTNEPPPTLLQFGDNKYSHVYRFVNVPHIKKFRSAALTPVELQAVTPDEGCYSSQAVVEKSSSSSLGMRPALHSEHGTENFQPIVWKLASDRHFKKLGDVYRYDTSWSHKKDMAIFLGQLTGSREGYDKELTDEENCHNMKRCRLVYQHANSTLVHARLTSTRGRLPDVLNGVELLSDKVKLDVLLEHKGIIMMEGNDVASGLKWALLSQSVVLMPPPKHTSWAMEELLQPWVHYVPLDDFATNVEERMQWVIDNDEQARRISERATLWMEDLVFHPDAKEDDRIIQEEILRRYEAHFVQISSEEKEEEQELVSMAA